MMYLTEKAAGKIKEIADSEGITAYVLRAKVIGGGCAGFSYDIYFDEQINELDEVVELDGVKVVVDPMSFQYLEGVTIDYLETDMGGGFKFINPNVTGTCGCGSSFSV
jgi:iron-sulfur cluster insertion protein